MKKILIIISICCFIVPLFAEKLWKEFETDMTIEEVTKIGKKLFNANVERFDFTDYERGGNIYTPLYSTQNNNYSSAYVNPDCILTLKSTDNIYSPRTTIYQLGGGNIWFYFYKNRLFGIKILYDIPFDELVSSYSSHYGKYEKVAQSNLIFKEINYRWRKGTIDIITKEKGEVLNFDFSNKEPHYENPLFIMSNHLLSEYRADLKEKEEREHNKQNQKTQEKINKLDFN